MGGIVLSFQLSLKSSVWLCVSDSHQCMKKPVTHALDAVGGHIDSTTPGRGRGGLQPRTAVGTVLSAEGQRQPGLGHPPTQMLRSSVPSAARVNPREAPHLSPNLSPVQNRCQGATGMGHALTRPFTGERFTLSFVMAEEEKTPQALKGCKCTPNYSEQTFQVLRDHRGVRRPSQAEAETRGELSAPGWPAATSISSTSQTRRHAPRGAQPANAETCPAGLPCPPCLHRAAEEPHCRETPTKVNGRDPRPQFPGTLLLPCASNAAQTFWGKGAEGNPSKRQSHEDGTQFPSTQRVAVMPQSCQRYQQQQPRL